MTSDRCFSLLWRVNAVLIFCAGVLGLALLLFVFAISNTGRNRHAAPAGVIGAEDVTQDDPRTLGDFVRVGEMHLLRATLSSSAHSGYGSLASGGPSGVAWNHLFFDPWSNTSYWLFPTHDTVILAVHELPSRKYDERERPAQAMVYEVVAADSNGDSVLDDTDLKQVHVSLPSGLRLSRVLDGVQHVNSTYLLPGAGGVLVFYTKDDALRVARIDAQLSGVIRDDKIEPGKNPPPAPAAN